MKNIVPCLWFDDQAVKAAKFYTSLFPNSKTKDITHYSETMANEARRPKGSVMTVSFTLAGQEFLGLNGGPLFKFTPATSFFVNCKTEAELNALWKKLSKNGSVLMEVGPYPFSKRFGWLTDQFGLSWQLNLGARKQKITPFLMFVGPKGKAEEAIKFYMSQFKAAKKPSKIIRMEKFPAGHPFGKKGTVMHALFTLNGQEFMAMDGGSMHQFGFTHAVSFMAMCDNQKEIDGLWKNMTKGGSEEPCGWLMDKYGVSWQLVPVAWDKMFRSKDKVKLERAMKAMFGMKKLDIAALEKAYKG